MGITRRNMLLSGLVAGAAPIIASPAIAQSRSSLRVTCLGGVVEKTLRESVIPDFEKKYGTDVLLSVVSDADLLPRLVVARNSAPFDVCMIDNDLAILGAAMGVWAPDYSAKLSNIGAIYSSCKPPATAIYSTQIYEYALVYSTEKVKIPPTSWADVWAPGLTVAVPSISSPYGLTFLYIAATLNGGSATNLEPGYAAIKRLASFKIYKNVSQGLSLFQQKEVDLGLYYSHRGLQMIEAGLPIGRAFPKEGTWGSRSGFQITRLNSNLEGALAWIDEMLGVPVQTIFAKKLYNPTNKEIFFSEEDQKRLIVGEKHVDSIEELPWKEIIPQRDAILDRWTREFG